MRALFALLLLLFPALSFAQELRFHHFDKQDGFAHQTGFDLQMMQDQMGFIWIPALNGLNRFDGREFRVFRYDRKNPQGLNTNVTRVLQEDEFGKIWIGTTGGGINIYDPKTETFEYLVHDPDDPESLCGNDVRLIYKDQEETIWVGVFPHKLCRCKAGERKFKTYPTSLASLGFLQQKNGSKWLGGSFGLFQYSEIPDTFKRHVPYADVRTPAYIGAPGLMESEKGEIWLTTKRKGQYIFNPSTQEFRKFPSSIPFPEDKAANSIFKAKDGHFWFGGNGRVVRYDPVLNRSYAYEHNPVDPTSVQEGYLSGIFQDKAGSLWFSAFGGKGLSVVHALDNPFETLPSPPVRNLVKWNDRYLLVNTMEEKVVLYDLAKDQIVPNNFPPMLKKSRWEWAKLSDQQVLWWRDDIGQQVHRVNLVNRENAAYQIYQGRFDFDSQGNTWFNHDKYYDPKKDIFIPYEENIWKTDTTLFSKEHIFYHVLVDQKDKVWLGGNMGGLVRYDPTQKKAHFFKPDPTDPNALVDGSVSLLFESSNGWIYIVTSNGLNIYQPEHDKFVILDIAEGLPQGQSFPIIEDHRGNIWLGFSQELYRLNPQDLSLQKFDKQDGLPNGAIGPFATRDTSGRIYMAMGNSLFRFHPDSLVTRNYIAPIVFTDFYLNRKKIKPGAPDGVLQENITYQKLLHLDNNQSDFGFRFVSPTFLKPDQFQYYYMLENYNQEWINIGNELEVHFTNIPAGNYRFKVKAQSSTGYWAPEAQAVVIQVLRPWWQSLWFYLLCSFLFAGIIFGWITQLQIKQNALEKEVQKRAEEILKTQDQLVLQDKMASLGQLTAGIAHEIKNPLNFVNNFAEGSTELLEELQEEIKKQQTAKQQDFTEVEAIIEELQQNAQDIHENGQRADRIIRSMMDHARGEGNILQQVDINLLLDDNLNLAYHAYRALDSSFNLSIQTTYSAELPPTNVYPQELGRVLLNLFNNACYTLSQKQKVAATDYQPQLLVKTALIDQKVEIRIRDNGFGIRPEVLEHIFTPFYTTKAPGEGHTGLGLSISYDIIVQRHQGSISVESEAGAFTEFIIHLPFF